MMGKLSHGVVHVRFEKKSTGGVRDMFCTTKKSLIDYTPVGSSRKRGPGTISVWDVDLQEYRSFAVDNVIHMMTKNQYRKSLRLVEADLQGFIKRYHIDHEGLLRVAGPKAKTCKYFGVLPIGDKFRAQLKTTSYMRRYLDHHSGMDSTRYPDVIYIGMFAKEKDAAFAVAQLMKSKDVYLTYDNISKSITTDNFVKGYSQHFGMHPKARKIAKSPDRFSKPISIVDAAPDPLQADSSDTKWTRAEVNKKIVSYLMKYSSVIVPTKDIVVEKLYDHIDEVINVWNPQTSWQLGMVIAYSMVKYKKIPTLNDFVMERMDLVNDIDIYRAELEIAELSDRFLGK